MSDPTHGRKRRRLWQKWWWTDYVSDKALLPCSWAAQGVWPRMLAVMWEAEPLGHFLIRVDGLWRPPEVEELAALWGKPADTILPLIAELGRYAVFSRTEAGVIYNRRMVADAQRYAADGEPTPSERELADKAIRGHLEQATKDDERRAKARARQRACRARKRLSGSGGQAVSKQRGIEHKGGTRSRNTRDDERDIGRDCHVTSVTVGVTEIPRDQEVRPVTRRSSRSSRSSTSKNTEFVASDSASGERPPSLGGGALASAEEPKVDPRLALLADMRRLHGSKT